MATDDRLVIGPYHGDSGARGGGQLRLAWAGVRTFGALLALSGALELVFAMLALRGSASPVIFAVLSGAADGFATMALGLIGGLLASVVLSSRPWTLGFVGANLVVALMVAAGVAGYLAVVSEVRGQIPAAGQAEVARAMIRTLLLAGVSIVSHLLAAVWGLASSRHPSASS